MMSTKRLGDEVGPQGQMREQKGATTGDVCSKRKEDGGKKKGILE